MEKYDDLPQVRQTAALKEAVQELAESFRSGDACGDPGKAGPAMAREQRANLIEGIAYKLTDLITIISGRVELLCEAVPSVHLKDLHEIRTTAMKGVAFSELLLRAVQACRREMGLLEAEHG